jgi:dienelactone hydrolase
MKIPTNLVLNALLFLVLGKALLAQPIPHHFTGLTVLPGQRVTLSLDGSVAGMFNLSGTISNQFMQMFDIYMVEASTNLQDWTPLGSFLRTNSDPAPLRFRDTNTAAFGQRFYRTFTNHLITSYPKPSGPFAVGMVDRVMIDPARTNLYRYAPATNAFMVTFWYPADPPPAGVLPSPAGDQRLASDTSLCSWGGYDPRWTQISPRLVGHRFRGLPLAAGTNKYPVILDSHGLPAWRKAGSHNAEDLASHGYVVVAIDHADCWATEFPDGRYLSSTRTGDVPSRLKDMTFLLDKVTELNAADPLFADRLDLERIGVSGGSYGGMVASTCATNARVKCAFLYDATNIQSLCPAGLQKPFLVALGETNYFYSEDLWLFNRAVTNAVFLQLRGAGHRTPSDIGLAAELPGGRPPTLALDACRVWFFDIYLKGQTPPFPTNPEIYNVKRK